MPTLKKWYKLDACNESVLSRDVHGYCKDASRFLSGLQTKADSNTSSISISVPQDLSDWRLKNNLLNIFKLSYYNKNP